jgi:predicted PurR-regulated permease PerM
MEQIRQIHVPVSTIIKILLVAAAVWALIKLATLIAVVLVSVVIAIACDPVVVWLERRRVKRWLGAMLIVGAMSAAIVIFVTYAGTSLTEQGRQVLENLLKFRQTVADALPRPLARVVRGGGTVNSDAALIAQYAVEAGRVITAMLLAAVVVAFLTVYLLIEGRMTWAWLVAYVPSRNRDKVAETAEAAREAILHYVVGNVVTSIFAAVVVFIVLSVLKVPAALLLAALAGICDFIPVLGFIVSSVPAVLLALTVSTATALLVGAAYVAYHAAENYLIAPRVYGNRLRLSNLAVLIAFAVGAELFGVIGALLALPVAAMYPCIEDIWLKDYLSRDAVEGHRRIERRGA